MIRSAAQRLSRWFNRLDKRRRICLAVIFFAGFAGMLALSICYLRFYPEAGSVRVPRYIGRPSGMDYKKHTDSLTTK